MLITKIYLAAMSRANMTETEIKKMPAFYLYVDEFQSFANESFADILSEARKYKLALTIAHQYIEQMPEEVRDAVFGNVGTTVAFRVGPFDAEVFEKIFFPTFTKEDMVGLGFAQIYLSLSIDGVGSKPFSATTLPPIAPLDKNNAREVIAASRKKYAKTQAEVEAIITDLHGGTKDNNQPESVKNDFKPNKNYRDQNNSRNHKPAPVSKNNHREEPKKSLSLFKLKPKDRPLDEKSTGKHKNDLKSALAELIMGQKNSTSKKESEPKKETVVNDTNYVSKPPVQNHKPATSEVPEEVLRAMLNVDDKSK